MNMNTCIDAKQRKLEELLRLLELPEGAYEKAKDRYEDLGAWLDREASTLADFDPHVLVQGSFALGTAIRPLLKTEEYDLDLTCKLRDNVSPQTHTQEEVKNLLGHELELYRQARRIEQKLEAKHRCWRLSYQDQLAFHMDAVPAILAEDSRRTDLTRMMLKSGVDHTLASDASATAIWITDDRSPTFKALSPVWTPSNPEGYAAWFRSRLDPYPRGLLMKAQIDPVPLYQRKSALQQVIQLLKRHRDQMFRRDVEIKPASVILTTLAGRAFIAGQDLVTAMTTVLNALVAFKRSNSSVVLNPVDPAENFADRWSRPESARLRLKDNFHAWIDQACADFELILQSTDPELLAKRASDRFALGIGADRFAKALGLEAVSIIAPIEAPHVVISQNPPRPWRRPR